ncbi:MAG: T9SS type A sorting domain-containing protein [Bacteroidales bacterium]|nr:T9SS type A sorting domain-containing protein [Bacteroidales bacterium]
MKKYLVLPCCFILQLVGLLYYPVQAQEFPNPFIDNKNTYNHEDIIILFNEAESNNITQGVFGYDWIEHYADQGSDLVLSLTPPTNLDSVDLGDESYLSVSTGRFNNDKREDMVYIVERDTEIKVGINTMYTEFVSEDSSYIYELDEPHNYISIPVPPLSGAPVNTVGDFDGDGTDEVAVAWWESEDNIVHIQVLDSDNSESLEARAHIEDQISLRINARNAFDLSSGDLNGDGSDEVILIGLEESGSGDAEFQIFVKVYEVNSSGSNAITPKSYLVLDDVHLADYNGGEYALGYAQTAVTGLRTHSEELEDPKEDIFAAFAYLYYGEPLFDYDNYFQFLIRASEDLLSLMIIDTLWSYASSAVFQENYPLEINSGDVNGDLTEDVVLMTSGGKIFTVMDDIIMFKGNSGGVVLDENNSGVLETIDRLELGDVDQDGRDEIITFSKGTGEDNTDHNFFINISGVLEDFSTDTLAGGGYTFSDVSGTTQRSYAIAAGNLDGNDLHFGEPAVYDCEYLQPVFIIGAIPSHFDIIGDQEYDVNNCYPEQDCDLEVKITRSQTTSTTTQVELTSDWAVSSEVGLSSEAGVEKGAFSAGLGISTSVEAKYGVKFNEVNNETNSQTISVAITASSDDVIQYLKIPITLYQYPVLDDALDTTCYVIAAFPANNLSPQTIIANGKSVFNYTPNYEVGNILSYPKINSGYENISDLPKTAGSWIILDEGNVPSYTMSPSGGINYTLTSGSGLEWTISSESYAAINTGISPLGFGIGLPENQDGTEYLEAGGLPTDYPPNAIEINFLNLYSNSISEETEFSITPTNIIGSPNEFNYVISPKIYWNTDGSGILSFEVDINNQPGSGSFWSTSVYKEKPDPALNLPYRYDLVHNPGLSNTENLDRTKSIYFSSYLPQENDTVSLFLKLFNYSFVGTGGPVEFEIYHEDPDEGGTKIEDIYGNTLFTTENGLGDRGRVETEVKFLATEDLILDDFTKIYVIVDPNNLIEEIHEDNNKGWTQFGYSCNQPGSITNIDSRPDDIPDQSLLNIYPNPGDHQVIIEHDLRSVSSNYSMISISNVMGAEVTRFSIPAEYTGKVYWNTRTVPSAMYIVNVITENGIVESDKLLIAR